ncbi:MAG: hypothetical protein Q7V57_08215 [Actinomycetota bacterium]|nr:hypothetical protein [Actinomycetota bacterium]
MDRSELNELKADLRRMQSRIDELETEVAAEAPVNRRNMLRGLGAAAVGAAAGGLAFAHPAAATDGGSILIGNSLLAAESPTMLVPGNASWSSSPLVGAFTVSNDASFVNINAALSCITAYADSSQTSGHDIGLWAASNTGIGAKLDGPIPLKLTENYGDGAPTIGGSGTTGQFKVNGGDLWFCAGDSSGASAKWRRITGPGEAGSLHPTTPTRVYDSRFVDGPLSTGANRSVSVANSIDTATGAVVTADFVPAQASAISANITVTNTAAGGFLAINPQGDTTAHASIINWSPGQNVANGVTLTLNSSNRQLTVIAGGGGVCDFIVDILGYYL